MKLQGSQVKNLSKKRKKQMTKQLDTMKKTRKQSQEHLAETIKTNIESYELQKKNLDEMEEKFIKQIEDLRRRKLILAGALSALNKLLEDR